FAIFVDAPLQDKAKPMINPNPSKAPWYFMGFQELLLHVHPAFGAFIIPMLVTAFFIYVPFIKYPQLHPGVWFHSSKGKKITIISAIFSAVYTFIFSFINDTILDFSNRLPEWPAFLSTGILSTLLYLLPVTGFLIYLKRKKEANKTEMVIAMVTIILSAYIILMLTGSLLRGEGMQFIF
ncbi:MAG TPA: hypothetical protein VJ946_14425, partial [Bacteroidales bacterium]|nr:hypothetical protein [Bacteroidales bacterium]